MDNNNLTGGYTKYEIAQMTRIAKSQIYGYFSGKHIPLSENITKISRVTKVPFMDLYNYFYEQYDKQHNKPIVK